MVILLCGDSGRGWWQAATPTEEELSGFGWLILTRAGPASAQGVRC